MTLKPKLLIFSEWLSKKSSKFSIALLLILYIIFSVVIFPFFKNLYGLQDQALLDVLFGFTPERAYEIITDYGNLGRRGIFIITGIVDFLYPLIYGPLLALLLSRLIINLDCTISGRLIILVPFVAVLFDYIENAGIIFMIADYPNMNIAIAWLTSIAGILKWL
ncbi:MAG: hypothetical protein R6U85_00320, partial [Salinivirgaceae bacterium]